MAGHPNLYGFSISIVSCLPFVFLCFSLSLSPSPLFSLLSLACVVSASLFFCLCSCLVLLLHLLSPFSPSLNSLCLWFHSNCGAGCACVSADICLHASIIFQSPVSLFLCLCSSSSSFPIHLPDSPSAQAPPVLILLLTLFPCPLSCCLRSFLRSFCFSSLSLRLFSSSPLLFFFTQPGWSPTCRAAHTGRLSPTRRPRRPGAQPRRRAKRKRSSPRTLSPRARE